MTNPIPDYRQPRRFLTKLPVETLETILALMLQTLPMPKVRLSNAQLQAASDLQLLAHETKDGLELESCELLGDVKPVRIPQAETDSRLPASDQFPVIGGVDDLGRGM